MLTSEIPTAPQLLATLVGTGHVVTSDALSTQETFATQILPAQGDYLHPVKENQPQLLRDF
jgi:predicted transposase YbfD/YdcC